MNISPKLERELRIEGKKVIACIGIPLFALLMTPLSVSKATSYMQRKSKAKKLLLEIDSTKKEVSDELYSLFEH